MNESDYFRPIWKKLVLNEVRIDFNFLAAKILLFSIQRSISKDNSESNIEKSSAEIFNLYIKNKDLPNAKKDIEILLNKY